MIIIDIDPEYQSLPVITHIDPGIVIFGGFTLIFTPTGNQMALIQQDLRSIEKYFSVFTLTGAIGETSAANS